MKKFRFDPPQLIYVDSVGETILSVRHADGATRCEMSKPKRVNALHVHTCLRSGRPCLLVCAYENDAKFRQAVLEGAISFGEWERRMGSLPRDLEVIFY